MWVAPVIIGSPKVHVIMRRRSQKSNSRRSTVGRRGGGLINTLINKLPFELHLPGYKYCGPGTRLHSRLARGDKGINPLDEACKAHDIDYSQSNDLRDRHKADRLLGETAWGRVRSKDASFGEKTAALTVAGIMKGKTKLGMGGRRRKARRGKVRKGRPISFNEAVRIARKRIGGNVDAKSLTKAARSAVAALGNKSIRAPKHRIVPIPKKGGFLPLIPIFAALGALGSLGGGAAAVAKAVHEAKVAKETLEETKRHNQAMEASSVGKGLYLKPYKKGFGLYLQPFSKNYR